MKTLPALALTLVFTSTSTLADSYLDYKLWQLQQQREQSYNPTRLKSSYIPSPNYGDYPRIPGNYNYPQQIRDLNRQMQVIDNDLKALRGNR